MLFLGLPTPFSGYGLLTILFFIATTDLCTFMSAYVLCMCIYIIFIFVVRLFGFNRISMCLRVNRILLTQHVDFRNYYVLYQ